MSMVRLAMFATCSMLAGCFQPSVGADELEPGQQPGDIFGIDAATTTGGDGGNGCATSSLTSLHVRVRTTQVNGRYAPRNIGALWIEDSTGKFVKTVELWAKTRAKYLTRFQASAKGNVVDAVTSATLSSHIMHDRTWNLTGLDHCQAASGNYKLVMELTDYNGTGASFEVPFTKMQSPVTITPADTTNFHEILVELK